MRYKKILKVLKETYSSWSEQKVPRMAAALSYYTAFSIAPLLMICIGIAGITFGEVEAKTKILEQMTSLFGMQGAQQIKIMLESASNKNTGLIATTLGVVMLFLGAMGVFGELQDGMNTIWGVKAKPHKGLYAIAKDRLLSLAMVLVVGFLLLVSLILSALITLLVDYLRFFQGSEFIWLSINLVFSIILITFLFALIFKVLPDVHVKWRDVFFSSFITALLFSIGKFALVLYLAYSDIASSYGAAGSLIIILIWVYYSAQILFFGAELSRVIAIKNGSKIKPARNAMFIHK